MRAAGLGTGVEGFGEGREGARGGGPPGERARGREEAEVGPWARGDRPCVTPGLRLSRFCHVKVFGTIGGNLVGGGLPLHPRHVQWITHLDEPGAARD
ncbi:hypothetical protein ACE1SV_34690 [Streptomyces sennicomposti]